MIECPDDIEVGKEFRITNWLWVINYPYKSDDRKGIGENCRYGGFDTATILKEVADKEVVEYLIKQENGGCGGIKRCFVCRLESGREEHGTAAGKGYEFFISYGAIYSFITTYNPELEGKLRNMKFK
jgi:hypothetical protein